MNKYFKEVVTLKALDFKVGQNEMFQPFFEKALKSDNPEDIELKAQVKNVCTAIPLEMNKQLEEIISVLRISKGRFLFLAIASAMEEAKALMAEIDIHEYWVEQAEAMQKQKDDEQEAWIEHNQNLSEVV
jgi:hypothetical protein